MAPRVVVGREDIDVGDWLAEVCRIILGDKMSGLVRIGETDKGLAIALMSVMV